ncbi:MAG TPA: efflux RND transporter periplasmic adaptor subunit [Longimicrobiales bacterium]|nr:efflux RND transporter periplasmic adaptor subunit [Longimicrobiales bacterium]
MKLTRRQKQTVVAVVAVAIIAFIVWKRRGGSDEEEVETAVTVETAVAVVKPLTERIAALGTVEARPGHSAEISAPEATRVMAIYVAEGSFVQPGQALVQLDRANATSRRQGAEATAEAAQRAYTRTQRLLAEGIAPRKDVETAAADLARAKSELEQAIRAEQLSTLRSPIAGIVTSLNAALSRPVDVAVPVVQVVDPRGLEIHFHVSPAEAGRITTGAKVELSAGFEAQRYSVGIGTITGISAALDSTTRSVDVRATISSPTRPLKVGESLNGAVLLTSRVSTVVIPVTALVPDGEGTIVFVLDANGVAHATEVEVGTRTETEASIVSGLKGGEVVVTHGAYGVTDSAHVTVKRR